MYAPEVTGDVIARGGKKEQLTLPPEITGGVEDPPEGPPSPPPPPRPPSLPDPIRISSFLGNQRKVEYDENLVVKTAVMNETDDDVRLQLSIFIKHTNGIMKLKKTFNIEAHNKSITKIEPLIVDFDEKKDNSGEYKAIATLKNLEDSKRLPKRTFTFFLHEEPPKKGRAFLREIKPIRVKGTSLEKKRQLPVTDKGLLRIAWDHPDFVHIRYLAGKRKEKTNKEILLYMVKRGIDGAIQKLLAFRFNEGELDAEVINTIKATSDEMYYDAIIDLE